MVFIIGTKRYIRIFKQKQWAQAYKNIGSTFLYHGYKWENENAHSIDYNW